MDKMEKKEFIFSDGFGDASRTVYQVFPGIQLMYHTVHMDRLDLGLTAEGNLLEIHHCREGRIEQEFADACCCLMPGDLSVAIRKQTARSYGFPLGHYHGITIGIHMDVVSEPFSWLLAEMGIRPLEVAKRLCGDKSCFVIRAEKCIAHIFSELYAVPEHIRPGYFKVKILELLLVLGGIEQGSNPLAARALPSSQVRLANQVAAYLSGRMDQHITIPALAKAFNVSDTHLKSIFKGVYGVPIYSYIRIQKMQSAAQLLIHTERPVARIAEEFGYSNTSKFSAAFQAILGDTPSVYRKAHGKYGGA